MKSIIFDIKDKTKEKLLMQISGEALSFERKAKRELSPMNEAT